MRLVNDFDKEVELTEQERWKIAQEQGCSYAEW